MAQSDVRLLSDPFNPSVLIGPFSGANAGSGGVCTFVGKVRPEEDVEAMELTHYEPLTLAGMRELASDVCDRFDLTGLLVVHRIGLLYPGEPIVCVSAAAKHRRAAIDAADFTMDHLKSASWFWKREKRSGGWHWIEPRQQDYTDLARWEKL